jgi:hypothetical protein
MSEQPHAHRLLLPDNIPISLDHLSNADLKSLVTLAGANPVGVDRLSLLNTLIHQVHNSRKQDWTLDALPVRRVHNRLLSFQHIAANTARGDSCEKDIGLDAPCSLQGSTPLRAFGLLCSYNHDLYIIGGRQPHLQHQSLVTRCIAETGLWEPVFSVWEPVQAFQDMPSGEPHILCHFFLIGSNTILGLAWLATVSFEADLAKPVLVFM